MQERPGRQRRSGEPGQALGVPKRRPATREDVGGEGEDGPRAHPAPAECKARTIGWSASSRLERAPGGPQRDRNVQNRSSAERDDIWTAVP